MAPAATYELLQGSYTIEVPDCGHMVPHITEEIDDELGKNVFVFHAHVNEDDDRCQATDRQRTEIRARAADIVARNGETVYYRWKFKLPAGFQTSPNFTHIFQIKSDLGASDHDPHPARRPPEHRRPHRRARHHRVWRSSSAPGWWSDLKILYANEGQVEMTIRRQPDGEMLFSHSATRTCGTTPPAATTPSSASTAASPTSTALRDEQVRFADFCASKQSAAECDEDSVSPPAPAPAPPGSKGSGGCHLVTGNGQPGGFAIGLCLLAPALLLWRRRFPRVR